ncbi:FHA domain-containing protein [Actinocrinis puniceicyclus]|uniref:FHA domain-containing protein n=1 Tax=Actinocrinis puniceicyclus TaxID=977794 RepID=A0A8J7WRL2_9ACTN|nr:FtsK/SpoIIIE domain-containing protein [Actinocrinis puniceicyclus]MBS2964727.1 FHA domain-containing protein [Actinocrinis puniceicyclus]
MKLKLTLQRRDGEQVDLLATLDADARIGELAEFLQRADPKAPAVLPDATLRPAGAAQHAAAPAIDPAAKVGRSILRSGMAVAVTSASGTLVQPSPESGATLVVTGGIEAGRRITLRLGDNLVGRGPDCQVRLADPQISRRHALITVGTSVEIHDQASANGVQIGQRDVTRAILRSGDRVELGDTELMLTIGAAPSAAAAGGSAATGAAFIRPPRLEPRFPGEQLAAPTAPGPRERTRPPLIPMVAPLFMGGMMYAVSGRSSNALVFAALSPLMSVGYAAESFMSGNRRHKRDIERFESELAEFAARAEDAARREFQARVQEHPTLADCRDAIAHTGELLWARRPGEPGFGELRLGTGRRPSRSQITLPPGPPSEHRAKLEEQAARFTHVDGVPVVANPADDGALGLAGPREAMLEAARALVIEATALHSPAELCLAAVASSVSMPDWDWLKWLPHTSSAHSPLGGIRLAATGPEAMGLVSELEAVLAERRAAEPSHRAAGSARSLASAQPSAASPGRGPAILVLVENDAPVERSRLVELAERGGPLGVHVLWLASDRALLPAACRVVVTYTQDPRHATAAFLRAGQSVEPLAVEGVSRREALDLARALAPLVDAGARVEDEGDLPGSVPLLSIYEDLLSPQAEAVLGRWSANQSIVTGPRAPEKPARHAGGLRAFIGRTATGVHSLDLRADGPHALVGGTTGAGKSELLQSWILALAANYSPQRVTFLLVDYKGGSAFGGLSTLPHAIGLVTDLDQHLVRRALISLGAELRYRERLFAKYRAKDLIELEKLGVAEAPPSLVIVVDEFAALVKELPEFVDGMIDVAQRGRSLGVHLILATQRPGGVITPNLRANTNLRVALRVADEADSLDVLGVKDAAYFDPGYPGRAVSKTGPGRLIPFQTAYAGGWTSEQPPPAQIQVEELRFGGGSPWRTETTQAPANQGPTDLARLVEAIRAASAQAVLPAPRLPWRAPLQAVYDLVTLLDPAAPGAAPALVFGVRDDPENQAQPTVAFEPDVHGNLAVYGASGSGKSTLLRALAIAAGFPAHAGPCQVYALDFGTRALAMLEELPHVGAVIPGEDDERVERLVGTLTELVSRRKQAYAAVDCGTVTDYRARTGCWEEPRVLLLIDNFLPLRQAYDGIPGRAHVFNQLAAIAAEGRPVGVHVVLSADRANSVPAGLASTMQQRVVLRMTEDSGYSGLGVPANILKQTSPPGRGLIGRAEIQAAILGTAPALGDQAANIRVLAQEMIEEGVPAAPGVARLDELIPLAQLPSEREGRPVFARGLRDLEPVAFAPRGTLLIAGPAGSGRRTALRTVAAALHRWKPGTRLFYLGASEAETYSLPLWESRAGDPQEAEKLLKEFATAVAARDPQRRVALFVDELVPFLTLDQTRTGLEQLVPACLMGHGLLVVQSETAALQNVPISASSLMSKLKSGPAGLLLTPDASDPQVFPGLNTSKLDRDDFPPGRALFLNSGKSAVVQVALADDASGLMRAIA